MSKVSLVKSSDSYQGSLRVLKPLVPDLKKRLANLDQLVIKINFVTTFRKLATTPATAVKAFIDTIKPFFKGKIIIAEEASIGSTQKGFKRFGFQKLAACDPQVEIFDSAQSKPQLLKIKYPAGHLYLSLAKIYLNNFVVSITRAKTHDSVGVTLAIKNLLIGAIQGSLKERMKIPHDKNLHWVMREIARHTFPNFVLIDGTLGMQGQGPDKGNPIKANFLAAGFDALAVDSLVTYLMGFKVKDIGYLNLMHQAKMGKLYPQDKMTVLGARPEKLVVPFQPHTTFSQQRLWHQ
jgi:uncharacterized protein (DUF362 family)